MAEDIKNKKKILVAEDDKASAELLQKILEKEGYAVELASNGKKAYSALIEGDYNVLLTDWMMPQMDGIELIRKVRENMNPAPAIVMITALSSTDARHHALTSGADEFIAKPYKINDIIETLKEIFSIIEQKPEPVHAIPSIVTEKNPPFLGICIAASSGGPQTLMTLFKTLPLIKDAALFIVQHGPEWALKDMASQWGRFCRMEVNLGIDGAKIQPGKIYLAPGKFHMTVSPEPLTIKLNDDPPENYIKPAADPLFRSVARVFGRFSMGIVLSGMGCDGTIGSQYISAANGVVFAQDPKTAIVKFMPKAVIENIRAAVVFPLTDIPNAIVKHVEEKSKLLNTRV
jgi:two-component system, chemotaxis family, protein-glutamate methylesterase/glutaminase